MVRPTNHATLLKDGCAAGASAGVALRRDCVPSPSPEDPVYCTVLYLCDTSQGVSISQSISLRDYERKEDTRIVD